MKLTKRRKERPNEIYQLNFLLRRDIGLPEVLQEKIKLHVQSALLVSLKIDCLIMMLNKKKVLGSFDDPAPSIHISAQHQPSPSPPKKSILLLRHYTVLDFCIINDFKF